MENFPKIKRVIFITDTHLGVRNNSNDWIDIHEDYFKNWFDWPNWVCWVLPVEITMSLSGAYEIIEWLVADVFFKAQGTAYIGTQGDVWDSQKDMALALIGAVLVMLIAAYSKKLLRK